MLSAVLNIVKTLSPKLAAIAGPALAAWIAKPENREKATQQVQRLMSRSAETRLLARIELAETALQELVSDERTREERRSEATRVLDELPTLRSRLRLPQGSAKARRATRKKVADRFAALMKELDSSL